MAEFIHSGCVLLDCVLGGGYPLGRISNIVGDKSTGKTLLGIEALINFLIQFPEGKAYYHEAEASFDTNYAETLGLPVDKVEFIEDKNTVEELYTSLDYILHEFKDIPRLYILDSLDALSDKDEKERKIDKGSYGAEKAKKLSEIFRRLAKDIENENMHLMIISQVRDKIGVMFGEKHSRSGGKALDFYASQIIWLSELGKIKKTISKIERIIGIDIKVKTKKNKIGVPFREAEFPIVFQFGIDDLTANLSWLKSVGKLNEIEGCDDKTQIHSIVNKIREENITELKKKIDNTVIRTWNEIESNFSPKFSKY